MSIFRDLQQATNEKDVENIFRADLLKFVKDSAITSPHKTDGVLEKDLGDGNRLKTLLEFKYNRNLKSKLEQAVVLIQTLYYLKQFQMAGEQLPSTIFVGDFDECFVLHFNDIAIYLTEKINWNIAPSEAASRNPDLVAKIIGDNNVNPFVFDIDEHFNIKDVVEKLTSLTKNIVRLVLVTRYNVQGIFDYFIRNILDPKAVLTPNQKAHIFIDLLINPNENFIHPKKPNMLLTKMAKEVRVNGGVFQSLFRHIKSEYTIREKEELVANVDMLVEMQTRRFKGEFFTPDLVALKGDEYLQNALGENYKDEYVIWDCAWGTGNLTKHHQYKELYVSTLEQCDIDTAAQMGINPEATKFQFDFLNDDLDKLPEGLKMALSGGKPLVFFFNPPFGTAGKTDKTDAENHKAGIAKTKMNLLMQMEKWGDASQQLYTQFLYRIWLIRKTYKLSNVVVGFYSMPMFLSGSSFEGFRKQFLPVFGFETGFLVKANTFSNVSDNWAISFSVFTSTPKENKDTFCFGLYKSDEINLSFISEKTVYNTDGATPASFWLRQPIVGIKSEDIPQLTSAISVKSDGSGRGRGFSHGLGYMHNDSNRVYQNAQLVGLYTSAFSGGNGVPLNSSNIRRSICLFSARRMIESNWMNWSDEYLAPNESHLSWGKFCNDAIVYSLFNTKSNQSSMRHFEYKGKDWSIKNEFFWLSRKEMMELAEQHYFDEMYQDARFDKDRYLFSLLFGDQNLYNQLSLDAKVVLDAATMLVKKSFELRKLSHQEHPEWHLQTWDAGWYQTKLVLKEYFKDDLSEFSSLYKQLENRMRPLVYELGFLRK
jgi:hypothetical protein